MFRKIILLAPIIYLSALSLGNATPVRKLCPEGDTCVLIHPNGTIKMATLFDNTTINQNTGLPALDPTFGIDDRRAVEVARISRPSVLGHDIELVGTDTLAGFPNYRENCNNLDSTLLTNAAQMNAIIDRADVVAVIGPICSNDGAEIAPIGTDAKHLIVSPNTQSPALTDPANRPPDSFFYRTAPNGQFAGAATANFALNQGFTAAAAISDGSIFSDGVANSFRNGFGNNTPLYSPTVTDQEIAANVSSIVAGNAPDIIYITNTSTAVTQKIVIEIQKHPELDGTRIAMTNATAVGALWADPLGADADGIWVSSISLLFHNEPDYLNDFLPEYLSLSGGQNPPNHFHGYSFDAYNIILDAIEEVAISVSPPANGANRKYLIPRQALRDALEATVGREGLTTGGNTGLDGLTCDGSSGYNVGDCTDSAAAFIIKELDCAGAPPNTTCNFIDPS